MNKTVQRSVTRRILEDDTPSESVGEESPVVSSMREGSHGPTSESAPWDIEESGVSVRMSVAGAGPASSSSRIAHSPPRTPKAVLLRIPICPSP